MSIEVTNEDFQSRILDANMPALVDFWAPWCGPCLMIAPILESLAEKYEGRVIIARINIDEADNQRLAQRYQIRAIPYLGIFKSGEMFEEIIGVRPEQELVAALDRALAAD